MKNKFRVLIALAVVPAAIGLTAPDAASMSTQFPYFNDPQNRCTGEIMLFEGNAHLVVNTTIDPEDGSEHVTTHFNTQGVSATGFPSGDQYVISDVTNTQQTVDISDDPVQTHTVHHLIINHTPNFPLDDYHEHVHVTLTWVDGVPTPFFERTSVECK
jgi:hypothetical protein